jgi:Mn-dependent DtxR family transcriptional regulator
MATTYHVSLFIQVPDEGETEAWQVEHALRDAAEEHLWQVVSLTVVPTENQ